jgi:hypothetical protein
MSVLSDAEINILANLEEAGEDHISALLNTVTAVKGDSGEIDALRVALTDLVGRGFLELAKRRHESSLRLIPLSQAKSLDLLANLRSFLFWSPTDKLWRWDTTFPLLDVMLTESGFLVARKILLEKSV